MTRILPLLGLALLIACGDDVTDDTQKPGDTDADTDTDSDTDADSDADTDPKDIGSESFPFEMEDINPSSPTYGTTVESVSLAGDPYALLFMDSRCTGCIDLANDVFAALVEHPTWQAGLPIYGVQSFSAYANSPSTIEPMVEDNDLPYLVDIEENTMWGAYNALNHDMVVISADGLVEAWLPLYVWPEDMAEFEAYMTERFGE